MRHGAVVGVLLLLTVLLAGCKHQKTHGTLSDQAKLPAGPTVRPVPRVGDEIVVAGQLFRIGAPVVLWTDPGGYDAYRTERRFSSWEKASYAATTQEVKDIDSPNRYGLRTHVLTPEQIDQVKGGGWPLPLVQEKVDQFVIHYDVCGTSRRCFQVLHDLRGLSVHFMLDIDGTIYQTLDVKERAWHAGTANSRSVGIEIANMGAYSRQEFAPLDEWYTKDESGRTRITLPARFGDGGVRTKDFVGHPARDEMIRGLVQGHELRQYDYTPQQYESLIKLTAALCTILPKIECDYPRDEQGNLITKALTDEQMASYSGVLGHYHVTVQKSDPGPAFQWDHVIDAARKLMKLPAKSKAGRVKTSPDVEPAGLVRRDQ